MNFLKKYFWIIFCLLSLASWAETSSLKKLSKDNNLKKQVTLSPKTHRKINRLFSDIPVQDRGRVKPFDTFAREAVQFIWGKPSIKGAFATHIVLSWMLLPGVWNDIPFILVEKSFVKKNLKLPQDQRHFSPAGFFKNELLANEILELKSRKDQKIKLDSYYKEIEKIESRLSLYQAIHLGYIPLWIPDKKQPPAWLSTKNLMDQKNKIFENMLREYIQVAFSGDTHPLSKSIKEFKSLNPYSGNPKIQQEVIYNFLKPFRISWILYLLSLVFFFSLILWPKYQRWLFFSFTILGFLVHTYGMALRSYIMSRPPVSNMFETLLWVPWTALVIALILFLIKKEKIFIVVASVVAFFSLFVSDMASSILGDQLEPLEAVLRSNFWLSTHVLIITMSYAAFFLAFIMGDFLMFKFFIGQKTTSLKKYFWFLTRCLQTGVFLLALGTILGGVWADYSWGRFWGWDPKEVWALVSLLGYLALLHARIQGWIKEFGLAMGSIFCFFLVIMAWYGVNFVLGQGLHSYGFGSGGLPYVLTFIGLHFLFMFIVWRSQGKGWSCFK